MDVRDTPPEHFLVGMGCMGLPHSHGALFLHRVNVHGVSYLVRLTRVPLEHPPGQAGQRP